MSETIGTPPGDGTTADRATAGIDGPDQPFTVVVGVSATSRSETALLWGAEQAARHDGRLLAVRAWRPPNPQATPSGTPASRIPLVQQAEEQAARELAETVAQVVGDTVAYETRLLRGGKRSALLRASRGADLLVVDAPRALTAGPMFAHRLIYAASCPVVVMPPRISGQPPSWLLRISRVAGRHALRAAGTAGRPGLQTPRRG